MVASSAICDLLYQLGISANYKGFLHTAYAVSLCVEQQDRLLLVTKWLYPDVARKYGTNWKAVERNIRTVSTIAWKHNLPCWNLFPIDTLTGACVPLNFLLYFSMQSALTNLSALLKL